MDVNFTYFIAIVSNIVFICFLIFILPRIIKENTNWFDKIKFKNRKKSGGWKTPGESKPYASSTYKITPIHNMVKHYDTLPYTISYCLLNNHELDCYNALMRILKSHPYTIAVKPRLSDFIYVSFERYSNQYDYDFFDNRINSIGIDLLICDLLLKPTLAIKLYNDKYQSPDDFADNDFVKKLCHTLNLPYLQAESFSIEPLVSQVSEALCG